MNYHCRTAKNLAIFLIGVISALRSYGQICQHVNMGEVVNSQHSENGPKLSPDGRTLYFFRWVSQDPESKHYGHDVWKSELNAYGSWSKASKMGKPFNVEHYNSVESVGRNGNTLLLRSAYVNGKYEGRGFSFVSRTNRKWSNPQKLNIKNFEEMQQGKYYGGTLSNDGTVLVLNFSEIKDAEESDLYVSFLEKDGTWSLPKNMGKTINSEHGECGAFISSDAATLYFASNRPGGIGCYDIYMSTRLDSSWQNWTEPKNLGPSVNTNVCDIHFSLDAKEEYAYLGTLNNSKYGGEDIVKVKLDEQLKPQKNLDILISDSLIVQSQSADTALQVVYIHACGVSNEEKGFFLSSDFEENNFTIYPNPADVNFFLEITGTYKKALTISIFDMNGKLLTKNHIDRLDGMYTQRFDLRTYAKGIYFVTLFDGTSTVSKKLIIK